MSTCRWFRVQNPTQAQEIRLYQLVFEDVREVLPPPPHGAKAQGYGKDERRDSARDRVPFRRVAHRSGHPVAFGLREVATLKSQVKCTDWADATDLESSPRRQHYRQDCSARLLASGGHRGDPCAQHLGKLRPCPKQLFCSGNGPLERNLDQTLGRPEVSHPPQLAC